jgi:trimeric autotransporter adhesin
MRRFVSLALGLLCLALIARPAKAATVPISVFPNPIDFGTVPENSTQLNQYIFVSNSANTSVMVTSIVLGGTNSSDFAFAGPLCVGSISPGQSCQMGMEFTPSAMGSRSANIVISYKGVGSPITIPLVGIGGNPFPNITATSPASVYAGSPGFTLTISGTGFLPSSTVTFNNSSRATTYVSSTQITASILASDVASTNNFTNIGVTNPAPGGGTGQWSNFQIISPIPTLNNVLPSGLVAGAGANSLSINGGNFATGAVVLWNGKPRPTTYSSSNQLQVQLTAADLSKPTIAHVAVSNPSPGGMSGTVNFEVSFPAKIKTLGLPANDMIWDPYQRRIYASLPSSYGAQGNSIAVINPAAGTIDGYHFAGSEPGQLALSDDGSYLYVGLNGSGAVQRLQLPSFKADVNVNLGTSQFSGLNTAVDLKVVPGSPHTFAVVLSGGCCGEGGPVEFFTDSTLLPNSITFPTASSIVFADASTLYGYTNGTLFQAAVDASGGTAGQQFGGLLTCNGAIQYQAGLVYGPGGQVLNPQTGTLAGSYDFVCNGQNGVVPFGAVNRVFALESSFNSSPQLESFNQSKFTQLSGVDLTAFNGTVSGLMRWGGNGLAFIYQTGCCNSASTQVTLVQSSMVLPISTSPNPVPAATALVPNSATHGSGNLRLTLNGKAFVPGSTVTWNGSQRYSEFVSGKQLTVYVPASDLLTAGTANVMVTNPKPGGGAATALSFTIN